MKYKVNKYYISYCITPTTIMLNKPTKLMGILDCKICHEYYTNRNGCKGRLKFEGIRQSQCGYISGGTMIYKEVKK